MTTMNTDSKIGLSAGLGLDPRTQGPDSELYELIKSCQQKIFSIDFEKEDGSARHMVCRLNVQKYLKGGDLPYNPATHNVVVVFEIGPDKQHYRAVRLDRINHFKCGLVEWTRRTDS